MAPIPPAPPRIMPMDGIYNFSSLQIFVTTLEEEPTSVFFNEAQKSPQERADVVCLWLPYSGSELLQQVDKWISKFFFHISPESELVRRHIYMPRLAVAAHSMSEPLKQLLSDKHIYFATSEHLDNRSKVEELLRNELSRQFADLCFSPTQNYPEMLRRHMREDTGVEGTPIENVIAAQYPQEQGVYHRAVRDLLAPYRDWPQMPAWETES